MKKTLALLLILAMCLSMLPAFASADSKTRVAGDTNKDGKLNGLDLVRIRKYLAGQESEIDLDCADVTGDKGVDGVDLVRLRKFLAGADVMLALPIPENPTEADSYYWNSSAVYEVTPADESPETMTEAEAVALMHERGFTSYPVISDYSMGGTYSGDSEASGSSALKHPMYWTYYVNSSGEIWTVYIVEGKLIAYPASYVVNNGLSQGILFTESGMITSYDDATNTFYVTIPYPSATVLMEVDQINAETLDRLTSEEIGNL